MRSHLSLFVANWFLWLLDGDFHLFSFLFTVQSLFLFRILYHNCGSEVVERHLLIDGFYDESDTVVRLISPKGESFDSSDTRIWGIDHSDIRSSYVAGMLVGPFLLSSLSLDQNDEGKNVLEIGLGGGSFSMALHRLKHHVNIKITVVELDPVVVKVAHEWFGVKDSTNHRVIVDDGLHFLENALSTGSLQVFAQIVSNLLSYRNETLLFLLPKSFTFFASGLIFRILERLNNKYLIEQNMMLLLNAPLMLQASELGIKVFLITKGVNFLSFVTLNFKEFQNC
ncbi:unnamed protein product [Angiostrongylus costaricensis]|uniref:PABS domain-containing protein n=1 Tax=Angiostrongylus costaricensis TaxID=334426 RepID=A0A0R3PXN3_ANGCS|nr:unnamed protein product [Angiostrongylus costaricensis]